MHPYLMSFVKFFVLASGGEVLGQRIRRGDDPLRGFGILPRAIVWGILGVILAIAAQIGK